MEVLVFGFKGLESLLVVFHCGFVLSLPFLNNALLHHHHFIRLLLSKFETFLSLQKLILSLCYLKVVLISELSYSVVVDRLEPANLSQSCVLLVTKAVDELSQSFVLFEVSLVVSDVRVKLHLLLMHQSLQLS